MSSQTLDMLFDVTGQSLYFDAPEGRPSSVTSSAVYENATADTGTAEAALTGSAAVEVNPNTTIRTAYTANQGVRAVAVTASTGIAIGRRYLASNAMGEREFVEVTAIDTAGPTIYTREPPANDYTATVGDTLQTTRIAHALDATWIADTANLSSEYDPNPRYRWRLVYVAGGATQVHDVYFDLVRYAARHDVSALDVVRKFPSWLETLPSYHRDDQGRELIEEAFREVKYDLYQELKADQSIRNREVMNELVTLRAGYIAAPSEENRLRYQNRFTQLLHFTKVAQSTDTGAASVMPFTPAWRR